MNGVRYEFCWMLQVRNWLRLRVGKLGSTSAAAKCAAATKHDSNPFTIEEEKPYAEVCAF